ncbi:MAG: SpoIIE family protein phosphatase [Leptospiraceae bacterium]|nr:SpoIIE family protein phosphatase [Leptospiraceae bacterium]
MVRKKMLNLKLKKRPIFSIRLKLFLIFGLFNLFTTSILSFVLFKISQDKFYKSFIDQKTSLALSAARRIDPDLFPSFIHPDMLHDTEYEEHIKFLRKIIEEEKFITWMYALYINPKDDSIVYALDPSINKSDSIWIESKDFSLKFTLDDYSKSEVSWNNTEYKDNFTIQTNKGVFQIDFVGKQNKGFYIDNQLIFEIYNDEPLKVHTLDGTLETYDKIKKMKFKKKDEEIEISLSLSRRGMPSSLPGWPFEETDELKTKIRNSINDCAIYTSPKVEETSYGRFFNIIVPIFGNESGCIGVVVLALSPDDIESYKTTILYAVGTVSFLIFIATFILSYLFSGVLTRPVLRFIDAVRDVSNGNLDRTIIMNSKDEFGFLAKKFNLMIRNMKNSIEDKIDLNKLKNELEIAEKIQASILPKTPEIKGLHITATHESAELIGGDFYDFRRVGENMIGILVADVSGHGVPAALISSMLKVAFAVEREESLYTPSVLLENINRVLFDKLSKQFITANYLFIDLESKNAVAGKAGHPPILVYSEKQKKLTKLEMHGRLIGVFDTLKIKDIKFKFKKGDKIYLFTDGVFEVENSKAEIFGEEKLEKFLLENSHLPGNIITEKLMIVLKTWNENQKSFNDDFTFLILEIQ